MRKFLICIALIIFLAPDARAMELMAPEVPEKAREWMPESTDSFGDAMQMLLKKAVSSFQPDLAEAARIGTALLGIILLLSIVQLFLPNEEQIWGLTAIVIISSFVMGSVHSMIRLGTHTIQEMSDYAKLLFPVMTAAVAAQGGITTSASLYMGTTILNALLSALISHILVPAIYIFLIFSISNRALGNDMLKKIADMIKSVTSWILKVLLMAYTTYMSLTGVVSGTTDAAVLKATKLTISSFVPVIGGILSDASESVLVSVGVMKNAAGVYGVLAVLALFIAPFLRIAVHYMILKATASICCVYGQKNITGLIEDFSSAMGLILAMTGAVCLLLLISTVCFLKGVD